MLSTKQPPQGWFTRRVLNLADATMPVSRGEVAVAGFHAHNADDRKVGVPRETGQRLDGVVMMSKIERSITCGGSPQSYGPYAVCEKTLLQLC